MTVLLEYLNSLPNTLACHFALYLYIYADINFMACIIVGAYRYRVIDAWVDDRILVQIGCAILGYVFYILPGFSEGGVRIRGGSRREELILVLYL